MNTKEKAAWEKLQAQAQSLQNAANNIECFVHIVHTQDKRKTVPMFCLIKYGLTVSPRLDYDKMTHFILGWSKGVKFSKQFN